MNFVAHWPCLVERGESTVPALLRSCNYTKGLFTISVADNNASGLWDSSYMWLEQKICCGGRIPDNVWSDLSFRRLHFCKFPEEKWANSMSNNLEFNHQSSRFPVVKCTDILQRGPSQVNQSVSISLSINGSLSENLGNAADPIPETAPLIETVSKKWCTLLMVDKIFAADLIRSDFHNHQTLNYAVFTWKSIKNHDAFTFTIEMGFTYVNIRLGDALQQQLTFVNVYLVLLIALITTKRAVYWLYWY